MGFKPPAQMEDGIFPPGVRVMPFVISKVKISVLGHEIGQEKGDFWEEKGFFPICQGWGGSQPQQFLKLSYHEINTFININTHIRAGIWPRCS